MDPRVITHCYSPAHLRYVYSVSLWGKTPLFAHFSIPLRPVLNSSPISGPLTSPRLMLISPITMCDPKISLLPETARRSVLVRPFQSGVQSNLDYGSFPESATGPVAAWINSSWGFRRIKN